jgi:RND family efflux transporter MFP subunit
MKTWKPLGWGAVLGVMVLFTAACDTKKTASPREVPVKTEAVTSGLLEDSTRFVGNLDALVRVSLRSQINGRITAIPVVNGEQVTEGTVIARLEPDQTATELASQLAAVRSAQDAVGQATANLRAARSQQNAAQATLDLQQLEYRRAVELLAEQVISQQAKDSVTKNLEVAQADLQTAKDQVKAAVASLQQAQANLRQAQANAGTARVNYDFKVIRSPISGMVADIPLRIGDYVSTGQQITQIVKNDVLDLRISVPTSRLNQLRLDLPVILEDPNTGKRLSQGRIYFISPEVDSGTQTVLTKAEFRNPQGTLRANQYVQARLIWNRQPGLLVPVVAVTPVGAQAFVFTVAQEQGRSVARKKPVQLGAIQGQQYQVLSGLQANEQVITSGLLGLVDGSPIRPEAPTASNPTP